MNKKRYCIPGKIYDLLWTDDEIFNESTKLKKNSSPSFPKNDQFVDENGFHMRFALAGYSHEDISIRVEYPFLFVTCTRMGKEDQENDEDKTSFSTPFFSRGIARRNFDIKYLVSSEFDILNLSAEMEHGLLKIDIPKNPEPLPKQFNIKTSK